MIPEFVIAFALGLLLGALFSRRCWIAGRLREADEWAVTADTDWCITHRGRVYAVYETDEEPAAVVDDSQLYGDLD